MEQVDELRQTNGQWELRTSVLRTLGATREQQDELLDYNKNHFDHHLLEPPLEFPFSDEPFVVAWEEYEKEAGRKGVLECLRERLVQLRFPVQEGINKTDFYRAATRRGVPAVEIPEAVGLPLRRPDQLRFYLHKSLAGSIPLLITADREDFSSLVRALFMRNEPEPIPASMGALTVAGYNNGDRIGKLKKQWQEQHTKDPDGIGWTLEFERIKAQKDLYQDRFIILSDGPYSDVSASELGLSVEQWREMSIVIRREHESTHYFTRRAYGSMKNLILDELIADFMGITAVQDHYRADWFLRFMGLEKFPSYRKGGRLQNYRGDPPLSDGAFRILQALVKQAGENLERYHKQHRDNFRLLSDRACLLTALTWLTMEELASERAAELIQSRLAGVSARMKSDGK